MASSSVDWLTHLFDPEETAVLLLASSTGRPITSALDAHVIVPVRGLDDPACIGRVPFEQVRKLFLVEPAPASTCRAVPFVLAHPLEEVGGRRLKRSDGRFCMASA